MRRPAPRRFESLEPRLAMAGMFQFSDVDGDIVTVRTNRGTNGQLAAALTLTPTGSLGGLQLRQVSLNAPAFTGTNLTITARPGPSGGDGQVDVGEILSSLDLGRVTVGGDLGRIVAGNRNRATPGLVAFTANSIGLRGTVTGAAETSSFVTGSVPTIRIASHFAGAFGVRGRAADAVIGGTIVGVNPGDGFSADSIGRMVVGGNIYGGTDLNSGSVAAGAGGITRLVIGGDVVGGAGDGSGRVVSLGRIGFARIAGSVIGSNGLQSGGVMAGAGGIGRLVVGGGITGGSVDGSGGIQAFGPVGSITVGGSIMGGSGGTSGFVYAPAGIGTLDVTGKLWGRLGPLSGSVVATRIGTLRLGGIEAGDGAQSGSVRAVSLGTVVVRGDIAGSLLQPALILALGAATPTGPRAIGSLTVGGNMTGTFVLGGYEPFGLTPGNAAARIGAVTVRGNMTGSSIVAGVTNPVIGSMGMPQFGNGQDTAIAGRRGSRIDSLVVGGVADGSPIPGDSFGVVANSIGTVRLGGRPYTVTRAGITPTGTNLVFQLI